jgi:hypothetical protein
VKTVAPFSHVTAEAGRSARIAIDVTNTGTEIDGYTAIVDGIDPSWVRLERPLVTIFPDTTDTVVIHLDIPDHCQAGDYLIDVRVISAIDPHRESSQDFWLTVPPRAGYRIDALPSVITAGGRATSQITVVNTGNCDVSVGLTAIEPGREVACHFDIPRMTVPYRSSVDTELDLQGRRPWFGQPVHRKIEITGESDQLVVEQVVLFNQRARVPRGVLTALTLLMIVLLWALIFLFVIDLIRNTGNPGKEYGSEFLTGESEIPLDLIRGTVSGSVVGGPSLDGIPAVTVVAYRKADVPVRSEASTSLIPQVGGTVADDDLTGDGRHRPEVVASGGTDEDGKYRLRTLIPGEYYLHFSAPGFGEYWYPSQFGDEDGIDVGRPGRDPDMSVQDLDPVRLFGERGTVSATIELPPGTDVDALEVEILPKAALPGAPAGFRGSPGVTNESGSCSITADQGPDDDPTPTATVVCTGVPTPGEYILEIRGDGFQTQQIDVSLQGGDDTVVDTARVVGEPNSITGIVRDSDGRLVAGASISVSSGLFEARVFSGSDGRFVIDDLPTPRDYVVDISLDGYVGQTSALQLLPKIGDEEPPFVEATLVAGIGTISGTVVETINGTTRGLGAVSVFVTGERSSAATATLTDDTPGFFRVDGIAVPGTYTVVFTAPGYATETRIVQFDSATTVQLETITMLTSYGQVAGTVVDPKGDEIVGAEIILNDGQTVRTTASTAPNGAFAFERVTPGWYSIVIRKFDKSGDLKVFAVTREVVAGQTVELNGSGIPLNDFGTISGVVTDNTVDENALANVFVRLTGAGVDRTTTTDIDGKYGFDGVDVADGESITGEYQLKFTLEHHVLVDGADADVEDGVESVTVVKDIDGTADATVSVKLRPKPGTVTGVVRSTGVGAERLENAEVTFVKGGDVTAFDTDVNGRFAFDSAPVGVYDLEVRWCDTNDYILPLTFSGFEVPAGGFNFDLVSEPALEGAKVTFDPDPVEAGLERDAYCPPAVISLSPPPTTLAPSP